MARLTRARSNVQDLMKENDKMLERIALQLADINETIRQTNEILRGLK